jgi:release factor glutamine methyltransferase
VLVSVDRALTRVLEAAGCVAAAEEAAELLEAAGRDGELLDRLVARRLTGEPLAWVTGSVRFCGLRVAVVPGVYIPLWQSEGLARRAAELLPSEGVAVDLCTGSGAIAAVLRESRPAARVVATDIDPLAVRCARGNGVETYEGNLDDPLPRDLAGRADVITAVVPYVPTEELHLLPRDAIEFLPRATLDGGEAGLRYLAEVVRRSVRWLRSSGALLLELGGDQADPVGALLGAVGFGDIQVIVDEDGDSRGVEARLR